MGSISSINNLSNSYLQSLLSSVTGGNTTTTGTSWTTPQQENGQLSPFAQVMSTLQQLEESNPTQYAQVTGQIATNLQSAAQTAQADGNSTQASVLSQLSTDFQSASKSGQLPNVQDLAQALGGGHHHHHHFHGASDSSASGSTDQINQLLSAFQTNSATNDSLNPMAIITNTLTSAGINLS